MVVTCVFVFVLVVIVVIFGRVTLPGAGGQAELSHVPAEPGNVQAEPGNVQFGPKALRDGWKRSARMEQSQTMSGVFPLKLRGLQAAITICGAVTSNDATQKAKLEEPGAAVRAK